LVREKDSHEEVEAREMVREYWRAM